MKRLVGYIITLIAVIVIAVWLFKFLTEGEVVINTASPYRMISLSKVGSSDIIKQTRSKLTDTLRTGQYVAIVSGSSQGASQLINVRAHQTTNVTINPPKTEGVEPVYDTAGRDLAAGSTQLSYLGENGRIYEITSGNAVKSLNSKVRFIGARWITPQEGVAEDSAGRLYSVARGKVTPLTPAASVVNYYDVSPQGNVFYSHNNDVYKGTLAGHFVKIYTSTNTFTSLAASDNDVTVINSPLADIKNSAKPYTVLVDNSGRATQKGISLSGSSAWSPDGRYLASVGNLDYSIYDSSLKLVTRIPNLSISNPVWTKDDRLLYSVKDELWTYNLTTGSSVLLANMPLGMQISQMTVSDDGSYAYVSLSPSAGGNPSIKRIGLKGQAASKTIYQLQSILPMNIEDCSLSLINFSGPTIIVTPSSAPLNQICLRAGGDELKQDGFDISKLRFRLAS